MNKRTVAALGASALAAGFGVAACGGSGTSPPAPAASFAPPASAPATGNAPDTAPATGPGGIPVTQTVHEGQPFDLSYTQNGAPARFRVTFDSITCGGAIFNPKVLAASDASMDQPVTIPQPPAGQKFCLIKFSVANEGTGNQPWSADEATVNVGMDAYQNNSMDASYQAEEAYQSYAQPSAQDSDFGFNPGVSGVSWAMYEIPAGATMTSLSVPAGGYTLDSSRVLVQLGGTS